jgi:Protein of unknown function (DUF3102)
MTKTKNVRSLDAIADEINKLERKSIIDIGDLLLEAKAQCEYGDWTGWLETEFDWSSDTASRYMKVAELGSRFRKLRNLNLAVTTLYELADHEHEEEIPDIIAELAKHATKARLRRRDAERVIKVGIGRHRFGDHPDPTLVQLVELDEFSEQPWYGNAVAALCEREPETDESASLISDEICQAYLEAERKVDEAKLDALLHSKDEAEQEAEAILDGPPPDLPPPIIPPEPQRLGARSTWAEAAPFNEAVRALLKLRTNPVARFVGTFSPADLRAAADFLMAIEAADKAKVEAA